MNILTDRKINGIPLVGTLILTSQGDKTKGVCRIEPPTELHSALTKKARANNEPFALVMFNCNKDVLTLQRFKVIINDPTTGF